MQSRGISVMLGLLLLTATVARADKVTFDYDRTVNFSKYKTFMWVREPESKEAFMKDRIMSAVNAQLRARGLRQVSDGADLAVGAHLATEEKHTWETYYTGSGWGWGDGWSSTTEKTYQVGTLTVDLFDARSTKLIWQGMASDTVPSDPARRTRHQDRGIDKMFRAFPPAGPISTLRRSPAGNILTPIIGA